MGFAETFRALSDPARRKILELLKNGRLSVIRETREKNFIFYELNLTVLEELMVWLSDLKGDA